MEGHSDDEIIGVLYTELLNRTEPCYASDICERIEGLRYKQEKIIRLLRVMCGNKIVVKVGNKYILAEKYTPSIGNDATSLSVDGPAHGVTCSTRQTNDIQSDRTTIPAAMGSEIYHRTRTPVAMEIESPVRVQTSLRAIVPVQQSVVSRSSSANSVCDTATVQTYTSNFKKIIDVLKDSPGPMKAKDIAQRTGIGQARKDVNRFLYFLQKQNILQDKGGATWALNQQVGDEDLQVYAAQLANPSTARPRDNQPPVAVPPPQAGDQCPCPNAGSRCTHIHFQQNNHYHQHNIQIGENNQMQQGHPPMDREHQQ